MTQYAITAEQLAEYLAVDDGVEWFNEKYPNATCVRCSEKVDGRTVVYCGDACETWYCADCHKDGTHDCPHCFPKKKVVKRKIKVVIDNDEEEMGKCEYCREPKMFPMNALQEWDKCLACPDCYQQICWSVNGLCAHCGGEQEEDEEGDDACVAKCKGWQEFVAFKNQ